MGDKFCDDFVHNWLQHQFFEASDVIRNPWIKLCGDSRMEALAGEQTPLHIAICLGLIPLVEKALTGFTKGTDCNESPLHPTARFRSGAYKILNDNGRPSLLTGPDQNGNTPLHEAAISGHLPMLSPLHLAFQFDHTEIVDLLVRKGADTTIKNNAQLTALELGAKLGRGDYLDVLKHAREMREETENGAPEGSVDEPVEAPMEGPALSPLKRLSGAFRFAMR